MPAQKHSWHRFGRKYRKLLLERRRRKEIYPRAERNPFSFELPVLVSLAVRGLSVNDLNVMGDAKMFQRIVPHPGRHPGRRKHGPSPFLDVSDFAFRSAV